VADENAIRIYGNVWEDVGHAATTRGSAEAQEFRHTRDFVSHAKLDRNRSALAFLQTRFGRPVDRFDPTDLDHRAFVKRQCAAARELIDTELRRRLW
jgi:hypothetical protein